MKKDYLTVRDKEVRKSNELIQNSRYNLSMQQQKILLYLIAQLQPSDKKFHEYELSVIDYCKLCGVSHGGITYESIKDSVKGMRDKSFWIRQGNEEVLVSWLSKAKVNPKTGFIKLQLDDDLKPYLLDLKKNFTSYELIFTLLLKCKYSVRLYELIKSFHYDELKPYCRTFALDVFKERLGVEDSYAHFKDFKRWVIIPAVNEVNEKTDKVVSYELVKNGRNVVGVTLTVSTKSMDERIKLRADIDRELTQDQLNLFNITDEVVTDE